MPIIGALALLWIGTLLDMASTYYTFGSHGDQLREVNQFFTPGEADFFVINAVVLFVLSAAALFVLIDLMTVKKYIQETGLFTCLKEMTSKRYYRKEDFVSFKIVTLVSILVTVGSIGGGSFLAVVNNVLESYGYSGFVDPFLATFSIHEQLAITIIFVITVLAFFPITYVLLRLTSR